ncbi:MAG: DUF5518 domain-containing protein [Candidatus Aminicenantes bacterium]|nr:DUF5518 domain-containing protein [Candidatus Aminicenantes bacterium]
MNAQRPRMLMPALIGGILSGVLTAIPFVSCLCCIWVIAGGFLAAYLLSKDSPDSLTTGDGVIVGVFAGLIGAVVDTIVSIPFEALMRNSEFMRAILDRVSEYAQDLPAGMEGILESGPFSGAVSIPWILLGLVISMIIFSVFSALGGIIGVSFFKNKSDPNKQTNNNAP